VARAALVARPAAQAAMPKSFHEIMCITRVFDDRKPVQFGKRHCTKANRLGRSALD
jgi:hypothetical protein